MENPERATQVAAMHSNILELRPAKRDLSGDPEKNAWSAEEDRLLLDLIRPGSPGNPFVGRGPQLRNQLCIQTERTLGKRMSEVLNIQVRDVDVRRNQVSFIRRPDAKEDQRVDQPLVKTKEHTISVSPEWIKLFLEYLEIRRKVPGARRHPYLFVNHKAGPTQGQPMTKGALNAVFVAIKKAEPRLSDLHSHLFRHNFNFELSESLDRQPTKSNDDQDAKIRANLNGWSEQSEMARVYNKRHVARRARELGLMTQERLHQKGNSVASPHDQPKPGSRHEP
jgi:integrase